MHNHVADSIFKYNLSQILEHGVKSETSRARYENGDVANSLYLTHVCNTYDLSKGQFPIITLRPIAWKSAIREMLWIYQSQSNKISDAEEMGVNWWKPWDIGDGSIGERYGAIVKKHHIIDRLLKQLKDNPYNRRNVISLWDYEAFDETEGLYPCAFNFMLDVRKVDGVTYLDGTLTQRSGDFLVAHHINAMQYVALQMMIACHMGWEVGKFTYFINNLHIYDNQFSQAKELLKRPMSQELPKLVLKAEKGTNFYDITVDDFEMIDYHPVKPQITFDLAI